MHNALVDYAVRLVLATRTPADYGMPDVARLIQYGASPRASLGIVRATRALALLRGRDYALPQDLQDIAPDILRHRLVLSYDALADDISADRIVERVLATVPMPTVALAAERRRRSPARPTAATSAGAGRRLAGGAVTAVDRDRSRPVRPSRCRLPLAEAARAEPALTKLQLLITRKLDGLLQGDYLGLLPGPGTEPGESREYRPGDDVRRMDWPVTARTTVPHVRQTVADRELETWLAVDLSASLDFGTARCTQAGPGHLGGGRDGAPDRRAAATGSARWSAPVPQMRRLPARPGRKETQGLLRAIAAYADRSRAGPTSAR